MGDRKKRMPRLTIAHHMAVDRRDSRLDWSRAEGVDVRDPRARGPPCNGQHDPTHSQCRIANQYMVKYKCVDCMIQMLYIPRHGCSGMHRRATELQPNHNPKGRSMRTGIPEDNKLPKATPRDSSKDKAKAPPRGKTPTRREPSSPPRPRSAGSEHSGASEPGDKAGNRSVSREKAPKMHIFNPKKETKKEFEQRILEYLKDLPNNQEDAGSEHDPAKHDYRDEEGENVLSEAEQRDPKKQWELLNQSLNMEIDSRAKRGRERARASDSSRPETPRRP